MSRIAAKWLVQLRAMTGFKASGALRAFVGTVTQIDVITLITLPSPGRLGRLSWWLVPIRWQSPYAAQVGKAGRMDVLREKAFNKLYFRGKSWCGVGMGVQKAKSIPFRELQAQTNGLGPASHRVHPLLGIIWVPETWEELRGLTDLFWTLEPLVPLLLPPVPFQV